VIVAAEHAIALLRRPRIDDRILIDELRDGRMTPVAVAEEGADPQTPYQHALLNASAALTEALELAHGASLAIAYQEGDHR